MTVADREAKDFFFPRPAGAPSGKGKFRYWVGYDKFFDPPVSDRIGCPLMCNIRTALIAHRAEAAQLAIAVLTSPQIKFLKQAGKSNSDEICFPTEKAREGARLLENLLGQITTGT